MRKMKVLISGNALSSVHVVEVVADVPVADLVPALMNIFRLPATDLYGRRLVYELRDVKSGQVIPPQYMLIEVGIQPAARLALDVSTIEEVQSSLIPVEPLLSSLDTKDTKDTKTYTPDTAFYSSMTLASESLAPLPAVKKKRGHSRRTFLLAVAALCGTGGVGLSYAAYHTTVQMELGNLVANGFGVQTPSFQRQAELESPAAAIQKQVEQQPVSGAKPILTFTQHRAVVQSVAWSVGNILASGGDDERVLVWGMDGVVHHTIAHPASVRAIAWSPDGQRLATGSNTQVAFFNAQTGVALARFTRQHTQVVTSIAWSRHASMAVVSGSADKRAIVWNTKTYSVATTYRQHTAGIDAVAWSANGQIVASSSDGGFVRIWTATTGQNVHGYYQDTTVPLRSLAFSPVGAQLATGGNDGIVRLWDAQACKNTGIRCTDTPQRIHVSTMAVLALAWSPDGHLLAVGGRDGTFSIWDLAQPKKALFSVRQQDSVSSVAWSADGKHLATASGKSVTVWEWTQEA